MKEAHALVLDHTGNWYNYGINLLESNIKDINSRNALKNSIKPPLHQRIFPPDLLKSSTNCGGYTRDNYFDDYKLACVVSFWGACLHENY